MAVLADANESAGRSVRALAARTMACLGARDGSPPLPTPLLEQLNRLSAISALEWARLEPEDAAHWLCWGHWWHKAGVRNAQPTPGEPEADGEADGEDFLAEDPGVEGHAGVPPFLQTDTQLAQAFRAWAARPQTGRGLHWLLRPATAHPLPAWMDRESAPPMLGSALDITQTLEISMDDLLWLAPEHAGWRERHTGGQAMQPSHYRYRLLPKPSGGLRLLEAPLSRLAQTQRRVLDRLLAQVPVHEAAHGFVRGRGVGSHARVHTQQAVVIRFDLADFFTSISAARVRALWRALGHGRPAVELLTRLTTTRTPVAVRERWLDALEAAPTTIGQRRALAQRLSQPHLPQGAPTSPALANLCAFGLDVRLHALAERFGARYTRYADDMVFSGSSALRGQFSALRAWVSAIANEEGFALRDDKTRLMPAHGRQYVTGLVVNQRVNYSRAQFDMLKARLHGLGRQPQIDAGERARLAGEVQWASQWLAPTRAAKLTRLLGAIQFRSP